MPLTAADLAELATRLVATAAIVVVVTVAVERLGPRVGGALVGLPIVIGPGFFFLIGEHGPAFGAGAAAASLLSLCATEAFLLAYCAAARWGPWPAIAAASGAWVIGVLILARLPSMPLLGLALFACSVAVARRIGRRFLSADRGRALRGGLVLLLLRGLLAGVLVAAATLAAGGLGAGWAGFLLTYPIGFSVVSITIHQRSGVETVTATLHAAMLGTASLAAFSFTLAVTIVAWGPAAAFATALLAGVVVTTLLTWRSRRA